MQKQKKRRYQFHLDEKLRFIEIISYAHGPKTGLKAGFSDCQNTPQPLQHYSPTPSQLF